MILISLNEVTVNYFIFIKMIITPISHSYNSIKKTFFSPCFKHKHEFDSGKELLINTIVF